MSSETEMALGREAKALMEHPTFQKVIDHLKARTLAEWQATAAAETDKREDLFFQMHGLDAITGQLTTWAASGDYAAAQLEKQRLRDAAKRPPGA